MALSGPAIRLPGSGSAATIRAGAARGRNTRSATAARSGRLPSTAAARLSADAREVVTRRLGVLLASIVVGALLVVGWTSFRIWAVGNRDDRGPADTIVVL